MQQADETFLTTTQEPLKLSIAISRYFSDETIDPSLKERYEKFLRQRSRAAMLPAETAAAVRPVEAAEAEYLQAAEHPAVVAAVGQPRLRHRLAAMW